MRMEGEVTTLTQEAGSAALTVFLLFCVPGKKSTKTDDQSHNHTKITSMKVTVIYTKIYPSVCCLFVSLFVPSFGINWQKSITFFFFFLNQVVQKQIRLHLLQAKYSGFTKIYFSSTFRPIICHFRMMVFVLAVQQKVDVHSYPHSW